MELEKLFIVGKGSRQVKKAWLAAFAMCGQWREACRRVGVSHGAPSWWIKSDAKFVEALERVKVVQDTVIKDEIWDRAINGTDKPIVYKGKITRYYKEKSDELLKFEAKARMSEYRDGITIVNAPKVVQFVAESAGPAEIKSLDTPQLIDSTTEVDVHNSPDQIRTIPK